VKGGLIAMLKTLGGACSQPSRRSVLEDKLGDDVFLSSDRALQSGGSIFSDHEGCMYGRQKEHGAAYSRVCRYQFRVILIFYRI